MIKAGLGYIHKILQKMRYDFFEEKVGGYEELIKDIEKLTWLKYLISILIFLLLHIEGSYEKYISENEKSQSLKEYSSAE